MKLKVEYLIIGVALVFFVFFSMRKCNSARDAANFEERGAIVTDTLEEAPADADAGTLGTAPSGRTLVDDLNTSNDAPTTAAPAPPASTIPPTQQPKPTIPPSNPAPTEGSRASGTTLYVVNSGVNVRAEPNVKAKSFGKLSLYDEVTFMGEVSENTDRLSIGKEEVNEPWVKVKTKRGTVGWIYGAYVSYYKSKKKGTW